MERVVSRIVMLSVETVGASVVSAVYSLRYQ